MMGSSPVTSQRSLSRERDPAPGQQYQQVVPNPYDPSVAGAQGNYAYGAAPSQATSMQYATAYQSYAKLKPEVFAKAMLITSAELKIHTAPTPTESGILKYHQLIYLLRVRTARSTQ